jgi:hypothetical protein
VKEEEVEEIIKEEERLSTRGRTSNINPLQVVFPLDGRGLPSVSTPSLEISLGGMEYNVPITTPISDIQVNINAHVSVADVSLGDVSLGDVNVGGTTHSKNRGFNATASAVTGGINASVDFENIRVTAGVEGHLLAKGVTKQISTEINQEGRLNAVEFELGKSVGVGGTGRVRVERIEPNIEPRRTTEEWLQKAISAETKDNE